MAKAPISKGKVAFVFPGQGSQKVGMGREAFDAGGTCRAVFDEADDALGEKLSTLCFEGPDETLRLTKNTQPAILTTSIALFRGLGETPDVALGHSLGEYSAHVAVGTLAFAEAVRLVRARGEYMQEAVPVGQGAMAAILKLDRDVLEKICRETDGIVEPVNYNSPGQIVIAGETAAVAAASEKCNAAGGRAMPLPVSAPFHCRMMKPAEERLAARMKDVAFADPSRPVIVNVDAAPVTQAAAAKDALVRQVSRSVRWDESVLRAVEDGVTLFVEIGVGNALSGMIKRTTEKAACVSVQKPADYDAARAAIAEAR
ncbi:MAG: ACP S-malonyltransferase [Sandaracinus sp.]